ncbi:MAG TPA: hypothetical protein VFC69_01150 [Dysgonamonadaceae bacterium]|nr:hypothetical protein [Dysgonamonadaceae bacterium]
MLVFPVMTIGFMSNIIASATASNDRVQAILSTPPPRETGSIESDIEGNIKMPMRYFFVNSQKIIAAGSFDKTLKLLMEEERVS